jgi:hypothetical protein
MRGRDRYGGLYRCRQGHRQEGLEHQLVIGRYLDHLFEFGILQRQFRNFVEWLIQCFERVKQWIGIQFRIDLGIQRFEHQRHGFDQRFEHQRHRVKRIEHWRPGERLC